MQKKIYLIIFIIIILVYYLFFSTSNWYDYKYKDELFIITDFLDDNNFNIMKKLLNDLSFKNDNRMNSRKTVCLDFKNNKKLYNLIYNNSKIKKIAEEVFKEKYSKKPLFPIEYRLYPEKSTGMGWHKDTSLFNPDCLEVVMTTENNSDMKFLWNENGMIKSINPKPNTIVIVRPNSVLHSVSPANIGTRKILKYIIQRKKSQPTSNFFREINNCPI